MVSMKRQFLFVMMAVVSVVGCSRPLRMFVREVSLKVEDSTSQPAAATYVTLEPVKKEPGDVLEYRERLDTSAMLGTSTAKTDSSGKATVPLRLAEDDDTAPKALLRVRRDTYFGYTVIPLQAGGRANLGSMAVEIISIGERIPYDYQRRTSDDVSLQWKGDQGFSK